MSTIADSCSSSGPSSWSCLLGLLEAIGTAYSNRFSLPNTESSNAIELLQASAPKVSGDTEQIVFATSDGAKVTDPSVESRHHRDDRPRSSSSPTWRR